MEYFRLYTRFDEKTMGIIPQIRDPKFPNDFDANRNLDQFRFEFAPEDVLVPKGHLFYKSRLTDLLDASFFGSLELLTSDRLARAIRNSVHSGVQFLPTSVILPDSSERDYHVIHPVKSMYECLDLNLCIFAEVNPVNNQVGREITISDYSDIYDYYAEFYRESAAGKLRESVMKPIRLAIRKDCGQDFFFLRHVHGGVGWFVSQKLRDIIEASGFSGYWFTEPGERYP